MWVKNCGESSSVTDQKKLNSSESTMAEKKTPIRVGFYDIEKTIGKGNFAVVKLARHRLTKTEVAIKIIDKTQLGAADLRRAYREVRVLKKLHHPHIIRLYQVMETKNMLYIVTEYAHQGEIFDHIAQHGRLPEQQARRMYWQVVSAVEYCHRRGVVHRDLKAENLLLDMDGTLKVADFGFSTWWSQKNLLSTWCGSPPYAAPEVFEGRQYTGPEVDVWSLGVVLYVLVCGALPFDAATLPALRDRVLSARYRVPYFMSSDCESLVRKMLVRDPCRRFTIEQIKRHRWMQADGQPRLLPTPGHPLPSAVNPEQYLDPGLVPDIITEPNEQILRLMSSLGIDSSRTRESLRQQSYDHHSAIYFLLLERLRQHRPEGRGPPVAIRMLSTDSSTCRRTPRRPSSIAEHAMRKMVPGTSAEANAVLAQNPGCCTAGVGVLPETGKWKPTRPSHGGPSQTSSIDEGVADMDSQWDAELSCAFSTHSSSIDSGILPAVPSKRDWKWPVGGSTSSSVLVSTDMSQTSGSPRESVSGSGTTLSSWDSAWDPISGGLATSLPSCAAGAGTARSEERRNSIVGPESPLSPGPCLTADRLWVPPPHPPTSPTEFRLGRRASDGLVGRRFMPFGNKLQDGARVGGVAELANKVDMVTWVGRQRSDIDTDEESSSAGEVMPDLPLNILSSSAKRPSLPESWKMLPDMANWLGKEPSGIGNSQTTLANEAAATSAQLHRQLMTMRLQNRRSGGAAFEQELGDNDSSRKAVLRQQSYKLAQQQPIVLPPLPGGVASSVGLEHRVFWPISEEESRLHVHAEEDEEDDDSTECVKLEAEARLSSASDAWSSLPATLGDCKLADDKSSLCRLSPLSHMAHLSSSLNPYQWDQNLHLPQVQPSTSPPAATGLTTTDPMDTSPSAGT